MIETDRSRHVFLKDFGAHVMVGSQQVLGIFDAEYQAADASSMVASSAQPAVWMRTADIEAVGLKRGDPIEVNDCTYYVHEHQPDGTGMSVVLLHKVP